MNIEKRTYRIIGQTRILGSQPANPKIHSEYIARKAEQLARGEEQTAMLPEESLDKKGLTVFLRDGDVLCVADYVIKGFLKEALSVLKSQIGIAAPAGKVDNYVMITPAYLRFRRADGEEITAPDEIFERPLRAMTMQGPRVSTSASEVIHAGWVLEFTIHLLDNPPTSKSCAMTFDVIEEALEYGTFKGLGQWRNAQNGQFQWVRVA